jgi:hypothetical protein
MSTPKANENLVNALDDSLRQGSFVRLVLSSPLEAQASAGRILARWVDLKEGPHLSLTRRYTTKTTTENIPLSQAAGWLREQLKQFHNALLCTTQQDWQWHAPANGEARLSSHPPSSTTLPDRQHDQPKQRMLDASAQDWLQALGVFNPQGKPRTGMADKYRQIERYLEIISHLAQQCAWIKTGKLAIADMGCGKAYLTFGLWHLLSRKWGLNVQIIGVDAREDLIKANQQLAHNLGAAGLGFCRGDIVTTQLPPLDALLALHACDTATDDAIRRGIELGAQLIVVAPCCHKAVRPQLIPPDPLAAILKHGLMEERLAEWLTDGLRALLLEASGYRTKIVEFVASEHTPKNLMITAIRQAEHLNASARQEIDKLKTFFGLTWPVWPGN